jgi:hypothetical protein
MTLKCDSDTESEINSAYRNSKKRISDRTMCIGCANTRQMGFSDGDNKLVVVYIVLNVLWKFIYTYVFKLFRSVDMFRVCDLYNVFFKSGHNHQVQCTPPHCVKMLLQQDLLSTSPPPRKGEEEEEEEKQSH